MRIVIDMQGAQTTGSRSRGIGRYTSALSQAIVRNRGEHDIVLALNGMFPDTIEPIRALFDGVLPQGQIRVWEAPRPVHYRGSHHVRRHAAELLRESFLAHLAPDMLLVSSLFEGLGDDAVTSVGRLFSDIPTAVILYDLIPLAHKDPYLIDPAVEAWYMTKIDHLRRSNLLLTISEATRQEALCLLGVNETVACNISTAADPHFVSSGIPRGRERELRTRYGLDRSFVMYTGGIDYRKNIEGLIGAYSRLDRGLRKEHQLAIVCSVAESERRRLADYAANKRLKVDEVLMTGFVPEEDLVDLYRLCHVFAFPSWHEGFGLPALEAMSCGAAVIAANTSSLPEVVGRTDALFNPHDEEDIAAKLRRVMTDGAYRTELKRHGLEQARCFSWDATSRRALAAIEKWQNDHVRHAVVSTDVRPRLAYISPLPPQRSGIAEYSAELLPQLSRYYDIDVVTQADVADTYISSVFPIRTVNWFRTHADVYDRVLYQFGNSIFHQHMFALLEHIPGVVVLHDFFLSSIVSDLSYRGVLPNIWTEELYRSHGYTAVRERFHATNAADVVWRYPCNLSVLQNADGIIVHSVNSLDLANQWYDRFDEAQVEVVPLPRQSSVRMNRRASRAALNIDKEKFVVCSFGLIGPHKLSQELFDAWRSSSLAADKNCMLVFVGGNDEGEYGAELLRQIRSSGLSDRVWITGWTANTAFRQYLDSADIAVQLRTKSRGETSAAALDCMNHGVATVVNAHGSMAELDDEAVWKMPDEFAGAQLVDALETLRHDELLRKRLGNRAREEILSKHDLARCARAYHVAIERFNWSSTRRRKRLGEALAKVDGVIDDDLLSISVAHSRNTSFCFSARQLFVDISEIVRHDAGSGIQRVVRNVLREWLTNPPPGFRIEPVYCTESGGYCYARQFTLRSLGCPSGCLEDDPIEFRSGDIFLALDLCMESAFSQRIFYQSLRGRGIEVYFVVYDLLCIQFPHYFNSRMEEAFTRWLTTVAECDGAICISKAVADDLAAWLAMNGPKRTRPLRIGWFHLGVDIDGSAPTGSVADDGAGLLESMRARMSFLMVGTLEPRKGHAEILAAVERCWDDGYDINLVVAGKLGWNMDEFASRLKSHPALGKRLFWLESVSDQFLNQIYASCTCLIVASEGEGFGLPIIEAARHKLPIIARDLPVFREVAGSHAFYHSQQAGSFADTMKAWISQYETGAHPRSDDMRWHTWTESVARMSEFLLEDRSFRQAKPTCSEGNWRDRPGTRARA